MLLGMAAAAATVVVFLFLHEKKEDSAVYAGTQARSRATWQADLDDSFELLGIPLLHSRINTLLEFLLSINLTGHLKSTLTDI